jgi:rifampicin phosphotransferase
MTVGSQNDEFASLLPLDSCDNPEIIGSKAAHLGRAASIWRVPNTLCVPVSWFPQAMGERLLSQLGKIYGHLSQTKAHDLLTDIKKIAEILHSVRPTPGMSEELRRSAARTGNGRPLAVRSSSQDEDGHRRSRAGIYESYLNVEPPDIVDAVAACWRSYYSARAVLARLLDGDSNPEPHIGVMIQSMVAARQSGIAFSQGPASALVESVSGLADGLVAGTVQPDRYEIDIQNPDLSGAKFRDVSLLLANLKNLVDGDVDVEWARDRDGLVLLQVRPVTAGLRAGESSDAIFRTADLYFPERFPPNMQLGACARVYDGYVRKRVPVMHAALASGCRIPEGYIVNANGLGWTRKAETQVWLDRFHGKVILDFGDNIRQMIVPASDLSDTLVTTLGLGPDSTSVHTFIVRRFVQGQAGVITTIDEAGNVLFEYSGDGLLAINRGIADVRRMVIDQRESVVAGETVGLIQPEAAGAMARLTRTLSSSYRNAHIEWSIEAGYPYLVDFSAGLLASVARSYGSQAALSPGVAVGPALVLRDTSILVDLSIAPIVSVTGSKDLECGVVESVLAQVDQMPRRPVVLVDRPYAILSLLVGRVAGFVFAHGSLLCHLAILLRESGTPAIALEQPIPDIQDGVEVVITEGGVLI